MQIDELAKQKWDVVIIGAGMGGGVVGYSLAKAGMRVLFCDKGRAHSATGRDSLMGDYAERFLPHSRVPVAEDSERLKRSGRAWTVIEDGSTSRRRKSIPFIGSGVGGSSALYGMAMERLFPGDFVPKQNFPDSAEATLPGAWPIGYDDLVPYYRKAETLFRVRGGGDPLRGAADGQTIEGLPELSRSNKELFKFLVAHQLHPYRLPMACDFVDECQCCQGFLCAKGCKNDSAKICVGPAISHYGAVLADDCEVLRIEADRNNVSGVVCMQGGLVSTIKASTVVLAAGALETPGALLRSRSNLWPDGLANDSGMVGRNLMRHFIDLYLLSSPLAGVLDNQGKELAFNDFYLADGQKWGSVQSFGRLPPKEMLYASMQNDLRNGGFPWLASVLPLAKPILMQVFNHLIERRVVLASILEDLPYLDNRVYLNRDGALAINYRVHAQDETRIRAFRRRMKSALTGRQFMLIKQAENNERIAHVCGTCRFGNDPGNSVLDASCRAHGIHNLYVADASFFPSSGGTNPALTIAANGLRVAERIVESATASAL